MDVALCDAELSMRVGSGKPATSSVAPSGDDLWSPWHMSSALESHIKTIRRALCVAVSIAVTMNIHGCVFQPDSTAATSLFRERNFVLRAPQEASGCS